MPLKRRKYGKNIVYLDAWLNNWFRVLVMPFILYKIMLLHVWIIKETISEL